jgi:hypothetical protein
MNKRQMNRLIAITIVFGLVCAIAAFSAVDRAFLSLQQTEVLSVSKSYPCQIHTKPAKLFSHSRDFCDSLAARLEKKWPVMMHHHSAVMCLPDVKLPGDQFENRICIFEPKGYGRGH